ncbi:DUF1028 domain-containing protein [bacterium]|nr:DUF1028 domain-containing protein [bacterium]
MCLTLLRTATCVLLSCLALAARPALCAQPEEELNIATFSVCAYDPRTGEVGVAVQSRFFGVGVVVPWCQAGVGAVASQAFGNPTFGPRILELMGDGFSAEDALKLCISADKDAASRQIGVVRANPRIQEMQSQDDPLLALNLISPSAGDVAQSFTGSKCMAWAGGRTGISKDGIVYACQGNILTGSEVVDAMALAMDDPASVLALELTQTQSSAYNGGKDLAGRLLGALLAGQAKGGDSRGMQSSALKVSQAGAGYGGYSDVKYDLRVDDAPDPFEELARLLNIARPWALTTEGYNKLNSGNMQEAIRVFTELTQVQPEEPGHHYNLACALARSGRGDEAMAELQLSLSLDKDNSYRSYLPGDTDLTSLRDRDDFKALLAP